ncbi:MAG: LexA family protein [Methylophilaceae bacterium]
MSDSSHTPHRKRRPGAGRKVGTGKFGENTTVIRIPSSQEPVIKDFLEAYRRKQGKSPEEFDFLEPAAMEPLKIERPLFLTKVPAGFPSPADDHVESRLDLNDLMVQQPESTFYIRIHGDSMIDAGVLPGDIAVVDRSRQAGIGDIVIAIVDGEFTIKTLARAKDGMPLLLPANPKHKPIEIKEHMQFEVWGLVTGTVRKFK